MPTYDYRCAACGHRFEVTHGVNAPGPEACPVCGSTAVRKTITAPAVHYKGSGWAKKERRSGGAKKVTAAGGSSSDADGTATDTAKPSSDTAKPDSDKSAAPDGSTSTDVPSGPTRTD